MAIRPLAKLYSKSYLQFPSMTFMLENLYKSPSARGRTTKRHFQNRKIPLHDVTDDRQITYEEEEHQIDEGRPKRLKMSQNTMHFDHRRPEEEAADQTGEDQPPEEIQNKIPQLSKRSLQNLIESRPRHEKQLLDEEPAEDSRGVTAQKMKKAEFIEGPEEQAGPRVYKVTDRYRDGQTFFDVVAFLQKKEQQKSLFPHLQPVNLKPFGHKFDDS